MKKISSPAAFLNLDLELTSTIDLSPLANHFGKHVFVLFNGKSERGYFLSLEALFDGSLINEPVNCVSHFIKLINSLPRELFEIWDSCSSRIFDFGFDGGYEESPLQTEISIAALKSISEINAEIRITVHPFREHSTKSE